MKLTTKTFSLDILSFYIFLIYKSFSMHDKQTQIQLESAQGRCRKLNSSELVCRHEFTQNVHLLTGTDDSEWNHICLERQQHLSQT